LTPERYPLVWMDRCLNGQVEGKRSLEVSLGERSRGPNESVCLPCRLIQKASLSCQP
jgi:hypothetical protein